MGGGYFDRYFSFLRHRQHWLHPKLIGVAFDCQKVEEIPANPWDIPLYSVITESR
jgi:5-formyltetrahydrofolate cyclo-ligase